MKYQRFEDLPVWQLAADLAAEMFSWASRPEFRGLGDLPNQLQRAALSISNNIAEGFERGTINELLNFLYIARGSAGEVRSMLCVLERMSAKGQLAQTPKLAAECDQLKAQCESISRQLFGWANSLQNSTLQGQRHVTEQSLEADRQTRRRDAFVKQIKESNELHFTQQLAEREAQSSSATSTDLHDAGASNVHRGKPMADGKGQMAEQRPTEQQTPATELRPPATSGSQRKPPISGRSHE